MSESDERQPWERQDWETATSYARFADYYLSLPPDKRSLRAAYNNYRADQGLGIAPSGPSGGWQRWEQGLDSRGAPIPGAMSWSERAKAWDFYIAKLKAQELAKQAQVEAEKWAKRRIDLLEKEWQVGSTLLDRAQDMLRRGMLFRQVARDGRVVIEPVKWGERDIAANAKTGSDLARRSAGLPRDTIAVDDWEGQLNEHGIDPALALADLISVLASHAAGDGEDAATGGDGGGGTN